MPRYRTNFVTEAIIRIDFENSIEGFRNELNEDLKTEIMKYFTLSDPKDAFTEEFRISPPADKVERIKSVFKEWNFYGNEKLKRFCVTKDFIFLTYKKYLNYQDFIDPFLSTYKELIRQNPDLTAKRLGMRYINNVEIGQGDTFEWNEYLNLDLLSILNVPEKKEEISRAFHILELNFTDDDMKLKYQYGMHNPDYPALIKQKIFVLDFDAYKNGSLSSDEIEHLIPSFHDKIEALFERSIKDKLRETMNERNGNSS